MKNLFQFSLSLKLKILRFNMLVWCEYGGNIVFYINPELIEQKQVWNGAWNYWIVIIVGWEKATVEGTAKMIL